MEDEIKAKEKKKTPKLFLLSTACNHTLPHSSLSCRSNESCYHVEEIVPPSPSVCGGHVSHGDEGLQ